MAMTCRHRPFSNGWSGGNTSPPTVWCGYCKDNVQVDVEWVNAYYDRARARTEDAAARQLARSLASVEADRKYLLSLLDGANP